MTGPRIREVVHPIALIRITRDFHIDTVDELPNAWRRFWYWALLGWRWESITGMER